MSSFHIRKTRNAPPSLFAAGKGVGRRNPLVLTQGEFNQHRQELTHLERQGYITITEVAEPSPVAKALAEEAELDKLLDKVVYVDDEQPAPPPPADPAEPEPEALDEKPEEVVEVPTEPEPEPEPEVDEEPEPAPVYDLSLLDQSVKDLTKDLAEIDDPSWLRALKTAENLGKTRKSAIAVIKERLEALEG